MTDTPHTRSTPRNWQQAMWRGMRAQCPACGQGSVFRKYLKVADTCAHCGEDLHHHRADDAPPYFTIFLVGHLVLPALYYVEINVTPPLWVHTAIWGPLTLLLVLFFLPIIKGAVVGLQWALRMHGFDGQHVSEDTCQPPSQL